MSLMSDQGLKIARTAMVFGFLGIVAMPVWAEKNRA